MYLVTFSVMLIVPYFLVRYTGLPLPLAGAVLATGFVAMAATSPLAGRLVGRGSAPSGSRRSALWRSAPGLFLVGSWQPDTPPLLMVLTLALHGLGIGLLPGGLHGDRAWRRRRSPHRGVAGSLAMLTRTIGVVTGAAVLTLAFQAFESAARTQGAGEAQAFLSAFRTMFRLAGIAAALTGAMIAWSAPRRR